MGKRGGHSNHKVVLSFNVLSLMVIILYILLNNTDIRILYILLGFSPALLAILINASISRKIKGGYAYFSIPFLTTTLFIILGSLSLNTLTQKMDLETLTAINFLYTLLFAFLYYIATAAVNADEGVKKPIEKNPKETNKEPLKEHIKPIASEIKKEQTPPEQAPKHIIHKVHVPHYIPVMIDEHEKERINPYIHELKKEFNIINIDSESIINSLRELVKENDDIDIHIILDKLEKNKVFFASNTGQKFHKPLCIVMNHISNDKVLAFKSREEAEEQGFKPCRVCMPK